MVVDLKVGETLTIGNATVRLEKKSGQQARLVVTADKSIQISHPSSQKRASATAQMAHTLEQ